MTTSTRITAAILVSILSAAACSASSASTEAAATAVPCDAKTVSALAEDLDKANGIGDEAESKATKARLTGQKRAFTGCRYTWHGNDEVSFGADGTESELTCKMKGGEANVKSFQHAAMDKDDPSAIRLDVRGVIAGTGKFNDLQMTECVISIQ